MKYLAIKLIDICLTIAITLIVSFVQWKFYNPFAWIFELPNYSFETRFWILIVYACYLVFKWGFIQDFFERNIFENNNNKT